MSTAFLTMFSRQQSNQCDTKGNDKTCTENVHCTACLSGRVGQWQRQETSAQCGHNGCALTCSINNPASLSADHMPDARSPARHTTKARFGRPKKGCQANAMVNGTRFVCLLACLPHSTEWVSSNFSTTFYGHSIPESHYPGMSRSRRPQKWRPNEWKHSPDLNN